MGYETEFDYGFGFTAKDIKPEPRSEELSECNFSASYLKKKIKEMEEDQLELKGDRIAVCAVHNYCDEDGDYENRLYIHYVSQEEYNNDIYLYSTDDVRKVLDVLYKEIETRNKILNTSPVDQEKTKGQSKEWSDGTFSMTKTTFDNGYVVTEQYDSCPGASRHTEKLFDESGQCIASSTFCEDAGNKYGDIDMLRQFCNKASKYFKPIMAA